MFTCDTCETSCYICETCETSCYIHETSCDTSCHHVEMMHHHHYLENYGYDMHYANLPYQKALFVLTCNFHPTLPECLRMEVQLPYLCIIDIIGSYKLTQQNNFIIRAPFQIYTHPAS